MQHEPCSGFESLTRADAYPHDPDAREGVHHAETHISHLFFTAGRVYKFRKAVDRDFLDFRERSERNADCLREVLLNQRLAPDVYLGLSPLIETADGLQVSRAQGELSKPAPGCSEAPEHCVVMRRLPEDADAGSLVGRGALGEGDLEALAHRLGHFHEDHRIASGRLPDEEAWYRRIAEPARANVETLEKALGERPEIRCLARETQRALHRASPWLEIRRRFGLPVDGHGDLRLEHVFFEEPGTPLVIDCVEFDASLRRNDPANDLGFLVMDLHNSGATELPHRFLQDYAAETDDFSLFAVVDHFAAYAAAVRAKVRAVRVPEADAESRQREESEAERMIALARRLLAADEHPLVIALTGVVGTGKSTVAEQAARLTGGIVVSSDRVRRRFANLFGIDDPTALYAPRVKDAVYAAMLDRAEPIVASGRGVVLDATFSRARWREAAHSWARERKLDFALVEARCPPPVVLARLRHREAEGDNPSEAGPERYQASIAAFQPIHASPAAPHLVLHTDRGDWREELAGGLRPLLARSGHWIPRDGMNPA
jgi:aminoglycoside phosphotransferase family enzyme/predicted kinase